MEDYVSRNRQAFDRMGTSLIDAVELSRIAMQELPAFQMLLAGGRVLDLGCGAGSDSFRLKRYKIDVQGLDISEVMLAEAKRTVQGVPFWQGDFRSLPFAGESFDGVWANGSLFYVTPDDLVKTLSEVHRVLKPAGVFFASYLYGEGERLVDSVYHRLYRPEDLEPRYAEAGFATFDRSRVWPGEKYFSVLAVK